jgi:uncharacterized protein YndB with AHSA1/START domain
MSTTKEETLEVTKNIVIDALPEVVFKAITDQNQLTNWFPDQAILETKVEGKTKSSSYKNSKRGQECGRDRDKFKEGTISEFILNKKISYTWEDSYEPDFPRTVVTWELEKIDNDKTNLKLLHIGFKPDEKVKQYDEGWTHFLNELIKYCEKTK